MDLRKLTSHDFVYLSLVSTFKCNGILVWSKNPSGGCTFLSVLRRLTYHSQGQWHYLGNLNAFLYRGKLFGNTPIHDALKRVKWLVLSPSTWQICKIQLYSDNQSLCAIVLPKQQHIIRLSQNHFSQNPSRRHRSWKSGGLVAKPHVSVLELIGGDILSSKFRPLPFFMSIATILHQQLERN